MSKIIIKKDYVEIPKETYEEMLLASNRINLVCEYAEYLESDLSDDFRIKNLKQMIANIRDLIDCVAKAECKAKVGVTLNPKKTLNELTDKIPFEIVRKRREA